MLYTLPSDKGVSNWPNLWQETNTYPVLNESPSEIDPFPKVIVLMEDDPARATLFKDAFERKGCLVWVATDIREALELLHTEPIHHLIVNVGMMGAGTILALREIGALNVDIPVACYTTGQTNKTLS